MANFLDRVISYLSPKSGAERARFRNVQRVFENMEKRRYEAASIGRRTSGWRAGSTGPNAEIGTALVRLRNRSRDLVRNNPHAARAIQAISSNVVGYGIVPNVKDKKLDQLWKTWGDTTECDADGLHNFYGLQNIVMREIAEAGEVLIRRRFRRKADGLSVPLQLQVMEADHIDDTKDQTFANGGSIKKGIEFNALGRRVAYWLFPEHPGEVGYLSFSNTSVRIPAEEILHLYRADRSGQIRGVPWGAPVLLKLKDFDEYDDAQLMRQKIAAAFAGFVEDSEQPLDSSNKAPLDERIEPGLLHILPPGKKITFGNPPTVGADYEPYARVSLRSVATGYGVTYECLTQDYSNVNFSSGRMGWIEFKRNIEQWRWLMLVPGFCEAVWTWFVDAAQLGGMIRADRMPKKAAWTPPKREMIDPTKETAADVTAVRAGFKSLSEVIREQGNDPEAHFEEMAADNELIEKYRLKLDSDPRTINSNGAFQTPNNNGEDQNGKASNPEDDKES